MKRFSLPCSKSNEPWVGHEGFTTLERMKEQIQRCFAVPEIVDSTHVQLSRKKDLVRRCSSVEFMVRLYNRPEPATLERFLVIDR